ncbi:S-layer homology domain-containing protein [Paenibacillus agaridevorans]|uniref:S-layer homology domain-containing protein n=1 Tax=Paenibacillus agaridevorans TaxID=171404 RepID=UPI000D58CBBD|nr:S-layer homology domain-containing protein [Paenibacillus agaridevorans]
MRGFRHYSRHLALIIIVGLIVSLFSTSIGTAADNTVKAGQGKNAFQDIQGHWAEESVASWLEQKLASGYTDGTFRPDQPINRGEFITLVNRAFQFEAMAEISFQDVAAGSWVYPEISKAVHAGYIVGFSDGTVGANSPLSREEAAVMISRLMQFDTSANLPGAAGFIDAANIANWSIGAVKAVAAAKIMQGNQAGAFMPKKTLTRAEAIVLLDRTVQFNQQTGQQDRSYSKPGTFGPGTDTEVEVVNGNVVIEVPGVTLRNLHIKGNLELAEGIGEGDVTLKKVTVDGTTVMNGGGAESVYLVQSNLQKVIIAKKSGQLRAVLDNNTRIAILIIQSSVVLDIPNGFIQELIIDKTAGISRAHGEARSSIEKLTADQVIAVTGKIRIKRAIINENGRGTTFEQRPEFVEGAGTVPVIAGNGGGSAVTPGPSPTPGPGSNIGIELVQNGGFEQLDAEGVPLHWGVIGNKWNEGISAASEAAKTGSYGVVIETAKANNPWVNQMFAVDEGATYELHSWFKSAGATGQVGFKIEFYSSEFMTDETLLQNYNHRALASEMDGQWHEMTTEVVAPPGSKYVAVFLRLYGIGKVYFDDASVKKIKDLPQVELLPNQNYYYKDLTAGQIRIRFTPRDGSMSGKTLDVKLTDPDGGKVLFSKNAAAASEWSAAFDPSVMTLNKSYVLSAEIRSVSGTLLERQEKKLQRLERPQSLPTSGPLMVDGEPFFPVIAYHANVPDYPLLQQIGVNTVQGVNGLTDDALKKMLDAAHANNLKMLVTLYEGMQVKENMERNIEIVTKFKDHPAVLGYMIMDEPKLNGINQAELLDAYEMIRSLDPIHPAYMVESELDAYRSTGQATDILVTDVYPYYSRNNQPISAVGDGVRKAVADVDGIKPVWTVLQTFLMPTTGWDYLPTITQVRNMGYQALLAGSKGLAFYSINDPGWRLPDSELWAGLQDFKNELPLFGELAMQGTKLSEHIDGPIQWGVWQKGTEQYAVAINTTQNVQSAEITLPQAGNYIELLHGAPVTQWSSGDNQLQVALQSEQAVIYRISPFSMSTAHMSDRLQEASAWIEDSAWSEMIASLQQNADSLRQELAEGEQQLDMAQTLTHTAAILNQITAAEAWVIDHAGEWDAETNPKLKDLFNELKNGMQRIIQAVLRVEAELSAEQIVANDTLELTVRLQNHSQDSFGNITVTITSSLDGVQPETKEWNELASGKETVFTQLIPIPAAALTGNYAVDVTVNYLYKDNELTTTLIKNIKISELLSAKIKPERMTLHTHGIYPFTLELSNHATRSVHAALGYTGEADQLSIALPPSADLEGQKTVIVNGNIVVPEGIALTEGIYELQIEVSAEGNVIKRIPLEIKTDPNQIYNPGFEISIPNTSSLDGWLLRPDTVWDHSVSHSGNSSIKILPNANNTWNVMSSTAGRTIDTEPGKKYMLSGWIKNDSKTGLIELGVREAGANDVSVKYSWAAASKSSDWTKYELPITVQPGTTKLWIYFKATADVDGPAWLDDVELREVP